MTTEFFERAASQDEMAFAEGKGLSSAAQQYDLTSIINQVRQRVDTWRALPASQWQVAPHSRPGKVLQLPTRLQTALQALYGHYEKTFELWRNTGLPIPP